MLLSNTYLCLGLPVGVSAGTPGAGSRRLMSVGIVVAAGSTVRHPDPGTPDHSPTVNSYIQYTICSLTFFFLEFGTKEKNKFTLQAC